jgi:hypothetical protein
MKNSIMKGSILFGVLRLIVLALFLVVATTRAPAITVTANYEKTLGQTNSEGKFSFVTSGGRIAVDEQGNAYFGTPGSFSFLQKLSPQGEILWQTFHNVPGFQGAAVDDKYLYTCGSGYYGYVQLQRWSRDTGTPAPGWQYEWKEQTTPINGVKPLKLPYSMLVDEKYLYVADITGNEIRRFDKASGLEAPFKERLLAVAPCDLAFTPKGTLLVLTEAAVLEVGKDGTPLKIPVIAGLRGPTAVDVNQKTGAIYVAEGGDNAELINRVRVYDAGGKMLNEYGIGGDFNGRWHPLSFAFSSGAGDVALDAQGGFWVNGYGHRIGTCPILTHFKSAPQSASRVIPDVTLRGVMGSGLAVDPNLDVYVGGSYKIGWDGALKWTSGLINEGPAKLFPTTLTTWVMTPVYSDGETAILAAVQQSLLYQVNARTGASLGKTVTTPGGFNGICVVGRDIFYTGAGRTIQRTTLDLSTPQTFMTLPETAVPSTGALAVSADQQLVFIGGGGETACYRRDGSQVWKTKGTLGALWENVLFMPNTEGPGVLALDAATGTKITIFGDKEENGRPPIGFVNGMATGSKDGADYLFIHTNARVLVYRINAN